MGTNCLHVALLQLMIISGDTCYCVCIYIYFCSFKIIAAPILITFGQIVLT